MLNINNFGKREIIPGSAQPDIYLNNNHPQGDCRFYMTDWQFMSKSVACLIKIRNKFTDRFIASVKMASMETGNESIIAFIIQQIVTLSKYGHDALDICHP